MNKKIDPSQEFVMACNKEAERLANAIIPSYLGKPIGAQERQEIIQIFSQYCKKLEDTGFSTRFSDFFMNYGYWLIYLLRHSKSHLIDPQTGKSPRLHL